MFKIIVSFGLIMCCNSQLGRTPTLSDLLEVLRLNNTTLSAFIQSVTKPPLTPLPDINSFGPKVIPILTKFGPNDIPVAIDPNTYRPEPIYIGPNRDPIEVFNVRLHSRSSPLEVTQAHTGDDEYPIQFTQSVDEPKQLVQQVFRPVLQDIRETISPYRFVSHIIEPVIENVDTRVDINDVGNGNHILAPRAGLAPITPIEEKVLSLYPTSMGTLNPLYGQNTRLNRIYAEKLGTFPKGAHHTHVVAVPTVRPYFAALGQLIGQKQVNARVGQRSLIQKHREYS